MQIHFKCDCNFRVILDYCLRAKFPNPCTGEGYNPSTEEGYVSFGVSKTFSYHDRCPRHRVEWKSGDNDPHDKDFLETIRHAAFFIVNQGKWKRYEYCRKNVQWYFAFSLPAPPSDRVTDDQNVNLDDPEQYPAKVEMKNRILASSLLTRPPQPTEKPKYLACDGTLYGFAIPELEDHYAKKLRS